MQRKLPKKSTYKKIFSKKNLLKKILFEKTFRSKFFLQIVHYKKISQKFF